MEEIFRRAYREYLWGSRETRSGRGSTILHTGAIREAIPPLIAELGVRSLLDIPCGDLHWMREILPSIERYTGADILPELIAENASLYPGAGRTFLRLDITADPLPNADLVLSRDAFVHFSFRHIAEAVSNLRRSGSTYLLTTTFTEVTHNTDITTGDWRPLNLLLPPFHFQPPLRTIREHRIWDGGDDTDKCLSLWKIADLPDNRKI